MAVQLAHSFAQLNAARLMATVPATPAGPGKAPATPKTGGGNSSGQGSTPPRKKKKTAAPSAAAPQAATGASPVRAGRQPSAEGAGTTGPGGFERMIGGNPANPRACATPGCGAIHACSARAAP